MEDNLATDEQKEDPFVDLRSSKPWMEAIDESIKYFKLYNDKCDNISKLYADLKKMSGVNAEREMQIFWANLEVLKPSIYSRPPVPVVASRFKDRKEINKHASEILERSLNTSFDTQDIDEDLKLIRNNLAMYSRGAAWVSLKGDDSDEWIEYDHLDRVDFLHQPARKWKEVNWVARGSWLTEKQMEARFAKTESNGESDEWKKADYAERKDEEDYSGEKKCRVYELWSKDKNVVIWITKGPEQVLDIMDPYLNLDRFFPCPKPAYGTVQDGTLIPIPDFVYYKDQIEEVNEFTARISALAEALRVKGFYAGGQEDVAGAIETAMKQQDNNAILIPVPNFAALGGSSLKDAIIWLPVDEIAKVVVQLIQLRQQMIEDIYQITGLSDIMRGSTDANETLGAQQLKSQYGSVRIKEKQEELIRVARDLSRLAGEIMAENFKPETLMQMSQYDEVPSQQAIQQQIQQIQQQIEQGKQQLLQAANDPQTVQQAQQNPEQAQQMIQKAQQAEQQAQQQIQEIQKTITIEQVMEFLKDERMRPFTLEIETDSTIQPDENANKQRVTEFMGALSTALAQLGPMVAAQPNTAPFAAAVLKFAVAPFRAGRDLDAAIDDFADGMEQQAQQPKPNPEAEKLKAESELKKGELELKSGELKLKDKEIMIDREADAQRLDLDTQKAAAQLELDRDALVINAHDKQFAKAVTSNE